jgi:predicted short-subunit dehydrogenase-like oxidoreductase (DUF2520 family)
MMKKHFNGKNFIPDATGMRSQENSIVLLGAGNVATQLGILLHDKGFPVVQVYNRTLSAAAILGKKLHAAYTCDIKTIFPDAGIYLFALSDSALATVASELPVSKGLWVHTAGSVPLDIFADYADRVGVLYPLQTFSKNRNLASLHFPFFIEANNPDDEDWLETIAYTLSNCVVRLSSEKRKYLHLAAVFACNFTNHLYALAAKLLEQQGLDWNLLLPLIRETASKVESTPPLHVQTGPAVRKDNEVIDRQLELLKACPDMQELYRLLSNSIWKMYD